MTTSTTTTTSTTQPATQSVTPSQAAAAAATAAPEEAEIPSPGSTLIYFILTTTCFLFFIVFSINTSKNIEDINNAKDNNVINFICILFVIIGSYFLNIHNSRIICNQSIE